MSLKYYTRVNCVANLSGGVGGAGGLIEVISFATQRVVCRGLAGWYTCDGTLSGRVLANHILEQIGVQTGNLFLRPEIFEKSHEPVCWNWRRCLFECLKIDPTKEWMCL